MNDRIQIQTKLLDFWVPCSTGNFIDVDAQAVHSQVCLCKGSGIVYPLRLECPCFEYLRTRESDWIRCLPCGACNLTHNDAQDEEVGACIHCDGLDDIFNAAPDALTEAINAKGWNYQVKNHYHSRETIGDEVKIYGEQGYLIGQTMVKNMLKGCAALETALCQTMEE